MRIWVPVALVVCSLSGRAKAGDKAAAQAAFDQGKALEKSGKWADACPMFEKSQANDPELGTEFNLADCDEHVGKLASAWAAYTELAQRDTNPGRKAESAKRAAAIQPRLIKLLISVRSPVAGLKVTRNGEDVSQSVGIESPVDPGEYEIGASADGYKPWSVKVSAKQEGGTVQVTVPELEKLPENAKPAGDHDMKPLPTGPGEGVGGSVQVSHGHKPLGLYVAAGGGGVAAVGLVFGALAMSKWSTVKNECGGDPNNCTGANFAQAQKDKSSASTDGNISTVLVGVGAAAAVTGVILYFTSTKDEGPAEHAFQIAPSVTPDGFAVTAVGRF